MLLSLTTIATLLGASLALPRPAIPAIPAVYDTTDLTSDLTTSTDAPAATTATTKFKHAAEELDPYETTKPIDSTIDENPTSGLPTSTRTKAKKHRKTSTQSLWSAVSTTSTTSDSTTSTASDSTSSTKAGKQHTLENTPVPQHTIISVSDHDTTQAVPLPETTTSETSAISTGETTTSETSALSTGETTTGEKSALSTGETTTSETSTSSTGESTTSTLKHTKAAGKALHRNGNNQLGLQSILCPMLTPRHH